MSWSKRPLARLFPESRPVPIVFSSNINLLNSGTLQVRTRLDLLLSSLASFESGEEIEIIQKLTPSKLAASQRQPARLQPGCSNMY